MPRHGPYDPEAEPRKESRRRRLGWGNGSFSIAHVLQTSGRTILRGMSAGACGGLLGNGENRKRRETETKGREAAAGAALEAGTAVGMARGDGTSAAAIPRFPLQVMET